jgi:uncharacterized protein YbjT (DUF2867 family)
MSSLPGSLASLAAKDHIMNSFSTHAWHQIVERYIEASGIAWTHLHPNVFMENLLTFFAPLRLGRAL